MCNTRLKIAIIESSRKGYQVAHELDWHPTKVSQIVSGAHRPNSDEKLQLANALGKTIGELFPSSNPSDPVAV